MLHSWEMFDETKAFLVTNEKIFMFTARIWQQVIMKVEQSSRLLATSFRQVLQRQFCQIFHEMEGKLLLALLLPEADQQQKHFMLCNFIHSR